MQDAGRGDAAPEDGERATVLWPHGPPAYAEFVASLQLIACTPSEIVVIKPAGLQCEVPRDSAADSLTRQLGREGYDDLRLVHRLDAPACGLVVVARTAAVAAYYGREIAARRWHKWYVARLARPFERVDPLRGSHKAYLKTEGNSALIVHAGGKPSFLDVVDVAPAPASAQQSDVLIRLHTGRFHQIRVMMANLGAPLVGDTRYGGPSGTMYLEHAILGARPDGSTGWQVWSAPTHPDRPQWHQTLRQAVETRVSELTRELALAEPASPVPSHEV